MGFVIFLRNYEVKFVIKCIITIIIKKMIETYKIFSDVSVALTLV